MPGMIDPLLGLAVAARRHFPHDWTSPAFRGVSRKIGALWGWHRSGDVRWAPVRRWHWPVCGRFRYLPACLPASPGGQVALLLGASGQTHCEVRAAIAGFGAACRNDDDPVTIHGWPCPHHRRRRGGGTSSTPTAKARYWINPRPAARGPWPAVREAVDRRSAWVQVHRGWRQWWLNGDGPRIPLAQAELLLGM